MSGDIDPTLPTSAPPGSAAKIAVLAARVQARLPLFVEGDALDLQEPPDSHVRGPARPPLLEALIMQTITPTPCTAHELAAQLGRQAGQRFFRALSNLREAGCICRGKLGWRLVNLQL